MIYVLSLELMRLNVNNPWQQYDVFMLYYSLFGIVGVTDESLEALAKTCSGTLKTLDVNGCINIQVSSILQLSVTFSLLA